MQVTAECINLAISQPGRQWGPGFFPDAASGYSGIADFGLSLLREAGLCVCREAASLGLDVLEANGGHFHVAALICFPPKKRFWENTIFTALP